MVSIVGVATWGVALFTYVDVVLFPEDECDGVVYPFMVGRTPLSIGLFMVVASAMGALP